MRCICAVLAVGSIMVLLLALLTPSTGQELKKNNKKDSYESVVKVFEDYALAIDKAGTTPGEKHRKLFKKMEKDLLSVFHKQIIRRYLGTYDITMSADFRKNQGSPKYSDIVRRQSGYEYIYSTIIKNEYKTLKSFLLSVLEETKSGPVKDRILTTIFINREKEDIKLFLKYLDDKQSGGEFFDSAFGSSFRICDSMFLYILDICGIDNGHLGIPKFRGPGKGSLYYVPLKARNEYIAKLKEYLKKKGLPKEEQKEDEKKQDK